MKPSLTAVSERLSYSIITNLDSNAADYPNLVAITIGVGHYPSSPYKFPDKGGVQDLTDVPARRYLAAPPCKSD